MRRVVITGGATGIGLAAARAFHEEGDEVVLVGRRRGVLREAAAQLGGCEVHVGDLTQPADVEAVAAGVLAGSRGVDVLVHCAGGLREGTGRGLAATRSGWLETYAGNVLTAVLLTTALADHLTRPGGRVVAVSSIAGSRGAGSYGAAKAALNAWVVDLAGRLAAEGITVNAVAPGFVPDTGFWEGRLTPEALGRRTSAIPVGRAGTPDEIAATIQHLAAPEAGFVTGQVVHANGGQLTRV